MAERTRKDERKESEELPKRIAEMLAKLPKEKQKDALERFRRAMYEFGEAIGVVAAQSIAEPATQTTLRAYHLAGRTQLVTTTGLPRLIEVFDARRVPTTPTMEIYLDPVNNEPEQARKIAAQIKETTLKQLIEEDTLDIMRIELRLSKDALANLQTAKEEVVTLIQKGVKGVEVSLRGDTVVIEPKKVDLTIKELQTLRMKVRNLHVKGIKGIEQAIVEKKETPEGEKWVIRTLGSNMRRILKMPGVDPTHTTSNNIYEVAEVLGIEAARAAIIREVITTMREQGVDTDVRHVMLVADAMTRDGQVKAIGRYGIAGEKASVLSRANFEETIKHLTNAAAAGEVDPLVGIIENIIVGNLAPIGTGLIKIKVRGKAKGGAAAKELPTV